jgi:hypothetical protein
MLRWLQLEHDLMVCGHHGVGAIDAQPIWKAGRAPNRVALLASDVGTPRNPKEGDVKTFDWHSDPIARDTPVTKAYRNTQNVRRFFKAECGDHFKFDRAFMAWLKNGKKKTMGDAADEWLRRNTRKGQTPSLTRERPSSTSSGGASSRARARR